MSKVGKDEFGDYLTTSCEWEDFKLDLGWRYPEFLGATLTYQDLLFHSSIDTRRVPREDFTVDYALA